MKIQAHIVASIAPAIKHPNASPTDPLLLKPLLFFPLLIVELDVGVDFVKEFVVLVGVCVPVPEKTTCAIAVGQLITAGLPPGKQEVAMANPAMVEFPAHQDTLPGHAHDEIVAVVYAVVCVEAGTFPPLRVTAVGTSVHTNSTLFIDTVHSIAGRLGPHAFGVKIIGTEAEADRLWIEDIMEPERLSLLKYCFLWIL
jgi:hypothetical protein